MVDAPPRDESSSLQPAGRAAPTWVAVITAWRWPVALVAVAYVALVAWSRSCERVEEQQRAPEAAVDRAEKLATSIAERFRTGRITSTFHAAMPRMLSG